MTADVNADLGMTFDYREYKKKIVKLCKSLNEYFLLPGASKYLQINNDGLNLKAVFNKEEIPFLSKDVKILPISNITVEELSHWFLLQLTDVGASEINKLRVDVSSGPGQSGSSEAIL
jgi:6-pyruvoyltetrahydropterin/6-carboxytetrahydropterin synthase